MIDEEDLLRPLDLLTEPEDLRLGLLTFTAFVVDDRGHRAGVLMECDCGRYITIPSNVISFHCAEVGRGRATDLPWSCEECEYTRPSVNAYRPWKPDQETEEVYAKKCSAAKLKRKAGELAANPFECDKVMHPKEWYCWQQAKRISKGVTADWGVFQAFYRDMGDAPIGGVLTKKNKAKPHGASNSYWSVPPKLMWNDTPVTAKWVMEMYDVPRDYLVACRKARLLDVQTIMTRYREGIAPPRRGEKLKANTGMPQFLID